MATIKAERPYDVADPDFDPDDGNQYVKQLFKKKSIFCLFCFGYFPSDRQRKRIGQGM